MNLELKVVGDEILRKVCDPLTIKEICSEEVKSLMNTMFSVLSENNGIGLAANQLGVSKKFIVICLNKQTYIAVANPEIISAKNWKFGIEGCLSVPGNKYTVGRAREIEVKFVNLNGEEKQTIILDEELARIVQHEIDHLNGILICDIGELIKE